MSSFEFLRSYDQEALNLAEKAESQFRREPNEAAVGLRRLGEMVAKSIAQRKGIDGSYARTQMELLKLLERQGAIPSGTLAQFHIVRKHGNQGAHEHSCTPAQGEEALRAAYQLSTWFFHEFVDPTFQPAPFVLPEDPHRGMRPAQRLAASHSVGRTKAGYGVRVSPEQFAGRTVPNQRPRVAQNRHDRVPREYTSGAFRPDTAFDPTAPLHITLRSLASRNQNAQDVIDAYAGRHAGMDVAVGLVGLLPGMAIPALVGAIVAQGPIVYRPMARDLAQVYLSESDRNTDRIATGGMVGTAMLDIVSEFGTEFLMEVGHEIVMEAGLGVLGSLCVPVIGGVVGAALDYLIANTMTWRVGTMVSMYFQNGSAWLESRKTTYGRAKSLTGGMTQGVRELLKANEERKSARVDLSRIPLLVPEIGEKQIRVLKPLIEMMQPAMSRQQIKSALVGQRFPLDIIEIALNRYY
jgi:hypothetical protein